MPREIILPLFAPPYIPKQSFFKGNRLLHKGIPVLNYGQCAIRESYIVAGIAILLTKCKLLDSFELESNYNMDTQNIDNFIKLLKENSIDVEI
ncbi:hypothetical protein [Saccharicrinis sp. GN24d3]|uniref:hypothetical protein n=1 Tax=Saccharicrinis sp. GN24d3 TaxID=3458416 RepID=UPI00403659F8